VKICGYLYLVKFDFLNGTARFFHRKGITIYNATYINLHQNVLFNEQKGIFEHRRKFETIKMSL
jgi:hypothetical protein